MATKKRPNKTKNKKKTSNNSVWYWSIGIAAAIAIVAVFILGAMDGFVSNEATFQPEQEATSDASAAETGLNIKNYEEIPDGHPQVTIEMENGKKITMELYPEYAPQTVANFVALAESGFYNGLSFHRVVEGFMAQGGDPQGNGMGGSEFNVAGEFATNNFEQNTLSHTRGVVSMARSGHPDSASSQFFICYDDATFLDGQYAAFGKVVEGMENVDAFLEVERTINESGEVATPVQPIIMKNVTVAR